MTVKARTANSWLLGLLTLVLLGYTACGPTSASLIPGPEFGIAAISTSAQANQEYVDVCSGSGLYMAVWQDRRSGTDYDIYGTILDANGNPMLSESFLISRMPGGASAANDQIYPAVGWNGTYFLVVWADRRATNLMPRIYGSRVTTTGQVLDEGGIPFPTAPTATDQYNPDIASNGTNWQIVWQEASSAGDANVYTAAMSSSGTITGRLAVASTSNNEQWPAIAWNGTYYLVAWEDFRSAESTGLDIYGIELSSAGSKTGSEKLLSTSGSVSIGAAGTQSAPSVAAAPGGRWLVVWQDGRGVNLDIYGTRVTGGASGPTVNDVGGLAISTVTNDQEAPSVGWDGSNFLVAWRDKNASRGIIAARVPTTGSPLDTGISLTAEATGAYGPSVAGGSGSSLVAWYSLDMSNANVYGAKVTSSGTPSGALEWSLCMQDQAQFSAAFDGTNYVVVWSDKRSGSYQIYAARVAPNGSVLDPSGVLVTATPSAAQTEPAICWNGTNYLVVWTDLASIYDTQTEIKAMRLSPTLTRVDTAPFVVNTSAPPLSSQWSPAVAWNGTKFLIVWADDRLAMAPNYYNDVRGATLPATGTTSTQISANIAGADNNQLKPKVASMGGNFLVVWEDYRSSGSPVIYCSRVSGAGAVQDASGVQVTGTTQWQTSPSITTDGVNYFVAWTDKRVAWSNDNIYGQRLSVGTAVTRLDTNDILICGAASAQISPSVAWNGANYLVAWQDARNSATTSSDIYLNQVTSGGAVVDPLDSQISAGTQAEISPCVIAASSGSALILYSNFIFATHRTAGRVTSQAPPTPVVTDDGAFSTMPAALSATWTVGSRMAEVAEFRYAIGTTPGAVNTRDWTSAGLNTAVTATGLSLADGGTYYFAVQARNAAGTWGESGLTDGIIVDASAPTTPIVTDDGTYSTSSTSLHAIWSSADPHTGIVEYRYAIGTTAGGNDVADWTSAGTSTDVTRTGLTLVDGTTYYFTVEARNGAGTWSARGSSDGILVDSSAPPVPVVTDDGQYTTSTTSLHATWTCPDPQTVIEEYQYAIGTTAGGTDIVDWTSTGTEAQVTKTGLTLADGSTYYFSVKARNAAGLWSGVGSSDGITVDGSAPTIPTVTDDGAFSADATSLHAVWSSSDPQSGVVEYRYAIGSSVGGTDIVDWTSAGTDTEVTKTELSLTDGATCYFSVQAKNAAGTWTESGVSDGITIDTSAPETPVVTDDGDYTQSRDTLHAVWISNDPQSGIAEYRYAIGTRPGHNDVVDWTSVGTSTEITRTGLSLQDGTAYCFSVEARNGAGTWSPIASSDGIMVDGSAPGITVVTDDGTYTASTTSLHAVWTCSDPHTIIAEYQYAIGTSAGARDIVDWTSTGSEAGVTRTGLSLSEGVTYYFTVKGRNAAGLWGPEGSSDGIMIDATAPTVPVVTDDGDFTTSIDSLHATWTASDPQSGIHEYQYAIGTTAGGIDILGWTPNGTLTEVTATGLTLVEGSTYYISVKAQNSAGAWSDYGASNGITVDASAPTTPVVTDDGDYSQSLDSLHATWAASDPHTGIQEYQFAIGTSVGARNIVDWTSTGTATDVTKTGLSLSGGATYYFSVRAKNGAGQWSSDGSSDGILVDATAPSMPVVTDDGDYALPDSLHATWASTDAESGIQEYQYAIGTSPGGVQVAGWTSVGTGTEITRNGLSLVQGTTYYISVKARNPVGLWSDVGSSNGISVPPAVGTILDAKSMPDNSGLRLSAKIVSAGTNSLPVLPGSAYFYLEESNRLSGIKIASSESIPTGGIVDIAGKLETINGERQITASDVKLVSTGATVPGVLNMMDKALGGFALNQYTPGVSKSYGPNNLGLLIKTWGKVSYVGGTGEDFIYLNGGSFLRDGSGRIGFKVYCGSLPKPALDSSVLVTGISSCEPIGSDSVRRVLATEMVAYP